MSKFTWTGLDEEVAAEQQNYIMRKFWSDGTIACLPIKSVGMLGFCPWTLTSFDAYDLPATVQLVNVHQVPWIPTSQQVVNQDVVLGWAQANHKPILSSISWYLDRIVQVEMTINTNLHLQKLPWLVGVDPTDEPKMKDIVNRILNDEIVVFADLDDLAKVQTYSTTTPYILDKLYSYKQSLEKEVLTILGVDNDGGLDKTHIAADLANANNDTINDYHNAIEDEINRWLEKINRLFSRNIKIECHNAAVHSIHDDAAKTEEPANEQ